MSSDAISIGVTQGICISTCVIFMIFMILQIRFFDWTRQFSINIPGCTSSAYSRIVHSCGNFYDCLTPMIDSYYFLGI